MARFGLVRGTRDYYGNEARLLELLKDSFSSVFERYGFEPLETPALELGETLTAKGGGGEEILKEAYFFEDRGGRLVGLRYDLTVPLARFVAMNPELPLPFKRYQIAKVWRYGDVARGRLREFYQCDVDIVGSASVLADAEVLACAVDALRSVGLEDFVIRLNNRKILSAIATYAGVEEEFKLCCFRCLDKLEKVGIEGVKEELLKAGMERKIVEKLMEILRAGRGSEIEETLERLEKLIGNLKEGKEGIEELRELIEYLRALGVGAKVVVDPCLARGLDYYTGPIFEIETKEKIGSIAGGGRYDDLIASLGGRELPATGISLGLERILEVIKEKLRPKPILKCFVASIGEKTRFETLEIVGMLRRNGICCEYDLMGRKLSKQLEYASKRAARFVVIVGEKELEKDSVRVRDMESGKEELIKLSDLARYLLDFI